MTVIHGSMAAMDYKFLVIIIDIIYYVYKLKWLGNLKKSKLQI